MDTENYNWGKFTLSFYYPVPVEKLFASWTTPKGLESFFIKEAIFTAPEGSIRDLTNPIQKGDFYHWIWRHPFEVKGEVIEFEENKTFAFSFGAMKVKIIFESTETGSLLYMEQTEIPDTSNGRAMGHLNCRSCWIFFMTNLKSIYLTGTDLRDEEPHRVSSMEVGYSPIEINS